MSIRIDGTNTAANPGITGADADTGLQFGTDEVNIVTGGSTRATVDSNGNLGLGTTSPAEELHINSGTPSIRLSDTAGSNLITRITNSQGDLYFDADFGGTTGDIIFRSNGTLGRWVAGGGLAFGADTAAVNQLDDYEEGTWTPIISPSSGTITSAGTPSGRYTKIGRIVTVQFIITIIDAGTAAGAYLNFGGLPFTSSNTWNQCGVAREQSINGYLSTAQITGNATSGALFRWDNSGVIVTGGNYQGTITYEAQ